MKKLLLFTFFLLSTFGYSQTAEDYFDQGMSKSNGGNSKGSIAEFTKKPLIKPAFAEAYLNRGLAKLSLNDLTGTS
jgi:hypothetical protein